MSEPATATSRWLVTTEWLASRLGAPDSSWSTAPTILPAHKRDAAADYLAGHIPGAVRFDSTTSPIIPNPAAHAAVRPKHFAREGRRARHRAMATPSWSMTALGLFSSPRVWWTFRLFGAEKVFILEGGMPKWKAEGRPIEAGLVTRRAAQVHRAQAARRSSPRCRRAGGARRQDRAGGRCAPGRPLPRRGAGAAARACAPATSRARSTCPPRSLVKDGKLLPADQLRQAFAAGGVDLEQAGHHHLRLGRFGGDHVARARSARQEADGALRRLVVGMGRAQRPAGRDRPEIAGRRRRSGSCTRSTAGLPYASCYCGFTSSTSPSVAGNGNLLPSTSTM